VYCVLTLEKQMVKTQIVSDFENVRWNEGFFFDVTQLDRMVNEPGSNQLVIALWAQDISRGGGQFLGQLSIPMSSVCHQKPVDRVRISGFWGKGKALSGSPTRRRSSCSIRRARRRLEIFISSCSLRTSTYVATCCGRRSS
jgi:hypothetical protein